jgi:hypothetical protein
MIETITLQKADQNQIDLHICTKNDKDEDKHKDKFCICDQIHLFSQCSYIVSVNKTSEWKENFKMRNETKQKIQTKFFMIYSIKRIANINILNELISSSKRKKRDEKKNENADDDSHFNFANSALANSTLMIIYHSLINSVIYDSNCSQSLIFDKIRFLNDLISSNDQIKISNDQMQIERYEIMRVWKQLKDKKIEMTFKKTTYIFICSVTLVFQNKLEKERFDRDSHTKILIHLKTDKQICEIQKRFEMQLLEYNLISKNDQMMTNSIQLSKNIMIKATSWQWHRRLEHCRSQMIDHLSKEWIIEEIETSKTIKCEICAVFKMHRLVQKQSSARTIKFVESYWLAKEWIATAVYLKWMRNSAHYIENSLHSFIYWSSSSDSSRFIWKSRSSFVTKIFSSDQAIFVFRCHFDLISSESHIHLRIHWFLDDLENQ